jgi:hypothetical protein
LQANRVELEKLRFCMSSAHGTVIACSPAQKSQQEGTAMVKIIGGLVTVTFVALAVLEWALMRL